MILRIWFLLIFCFLRSAYGDFPEFESQLGRGVFSRAYLNFSSGSILFQSAKNRSIFLKTSGTGKILINGTDVSNLPTEEDFRRFSYIQKGMDQLLEMIDIFHKKESSESTKIEKIFKYRKRASDLLRDVESIRQWSIDQIQTDTQRKAEIENLQQIAERIRKTMETDYCEQKPCKNGGICISQYGGFYCHCPKEFQGDTCETDYDECEYQTPGGLCLNNGTCVNNFGGYECDCAKGFYGSSCLLKNPECEMNDDLCGEHGTCMSDSSKPSGFTCDCSPGYQISNHPTNPICVDIDECHSNPCHPGIECLNLQGSFECKGCPPGFEKAGTNCVDINECEKFEACDKRVQCINTLGSFKCTACPQGFLGDPKTGCSENPDKCDPNPCPDLATCTTVDNSYLCTCPDGYIGGSNYYGGIHDCEISNVTICSEDKCLNGGTCRMIKEDKFRCDCPKNYIGKYCELGSPCYNDNPCKNGGICKVDDDLEAYCDCPNNFYGDECEVEEKNCDRHFSAKQGTFTFEPFISTNCQFVFNIHGADNQALRIIFNEYDDFNRYPYGPTNCSTTTGRLEIYDGPAVNYHKLHVFCGNQNDDFSPKIHQAIKFSSSSAMILFRGTSGSFSIFWKLEKKECGYRTTAPEGIITIPDHEQDFSCEWFINAPAPKVIEITIPPIEMFTGEKTDCYSNELALHDGFFKNDQNILEAICSNSPETITRKTISSHLTVSFMTFLEDNEQSKLMAGSTLRYKFVDPEYECGGDFKNKANELGLSGRIRSPNFEGFYPPNIHCFYTINMTHNVEMEIKFSFDMLDVVTEHGDRKCIWGDILKLETMNNHIFSFCNGVSLKPDFALKLPMQFYAFNFTSNHQYQGRGFDIEFNVECNQKFEGNGSVQTWNYPNGGMSGECSYTFNAQPHQLTTITFSEDTYNSFDSIRGTIEFRSDLVDSRIFNLEHDLLMFLPKSFHVNGEFKIIVKQKEDQKGYSFEYSTIDIGCGGLFTDDQGTITSPQYPSDTYENLNCIYIIESVDTKSIVLTFDQINLSGSVTLECNKDYIEIYDGYENQENPGNVIRRICGSQRLPPIHSRTNRLAVKLITQSYFYSKSFSATYKIVDSTTTCDKSFFGESGEIVVFYNETLFEKCHYYIKVPEHHTMRVELVLENLASGYIAIYNGRDEESPCEYSTGLNDKEKSFISFHDEVYIRVNSYLKPLRGNFKIIYNVVSKGCGGKITGLYGDVQTPQYPHAERRTLKCEWLISVPAGNWISLKFEKFNFQSMPYGKNIEFYEITSGRNEKLLDHGMPNDGQDFNLKTKGNQLKIIYHQESNFDQLKYFGFLARFEKICEDVVLKDMSGMIEVAVMQELYFLNHCNYEVQVPLGNRIMLHFHQFDIEAAYGYDTDKNSRFEVNSEDFNSSVVNTNGTILQNSSINIFNRKIKPISIISQHNTLRFNFSTEFTKKNKISLTYRAVGCVGELKTPQDIVISREDLDQNATRVECEYRIIAPNGKTISVYVNKFNYLMRKDCEYQANETFDGAAFFMGTSRQFDEPFKTVCSSKNNVKGYTNELFIYMSFDITELKKDDKIIFNATVKFEKFANHEDESTCGGSYELLQAPHKIVVSHLVTNVKCHWTFMTEPGTHLEFTLENYTSDYPYHIPCDIREEWELGYLTIQNYGNEVKSFCYPTSSPEVVEVNSMTADVIFMSPRDKNRKRSFVLTARPVCGGLVLAKKEDEIGYITHDQIGVCNITIKKSSDDDDKLLVDLLSFNEKTSDEMTSTITIYADGELKGVVSIYHKSILYYTAKKEIVLSVDQKTTNKHMGYYNYRTSKTECWNFETAAEGTIIAPDSEIDQPIDCIWKIDIFGGTFATFSLEYHNLPKNPHCADSYIEVRDGEKPGQVLLRQCDPNALDITEFRAHSLLVTLRYRPISASKGTKIEFRGRYTTGAGGFIKTRSIITPWLREKQVFEWITDLGNQSMSENVEGIRVDVKELLLVDSDSYVEIAEISDDLIKGEVLKTLTKDDNDVEQHIISYSSMVKITAKSSNKDWYNITWEPFNQTNRHEIAGYDCGEELTATWEWQIIEAPRDEGASGYKSNVHCKWIVHSDQFDTIEYEPLQIDLMDEESGDCEDFIYFSDEWKGDKPKGKICEMPKTWSGSSRTSHFNLHFVSGQDASNNNGGFKIRYRLSCGNVVRIPRSNVNQYELTSPNYPSNMNRSESCLWVVFLTSRRLLNAQIVDIDIKEEQPCSVNNSLSLMSYDNFKPSHYCGHSAENPINFVSNLSTMKIEYNAELSDRRGFKLLLSENITECLDGTIHLTENKPSRMIYSPNYPAKIPISTECEYVISAPHGHRIMVTFDHNEFDLVNKLNNFTDLDFIELRDGPIEHSPLLGKYQGHEAPPTKFSSSNVMFMKLSTHWNLQLGGFVAKFEIAKCGGTKVIYDSEEVFYIIAPFTDTDIDCQWIVKSQNTHLLKMRFERLKIKHGSNCPEQQLVVYDGNVNSSTLYNNDCYPIPESEWKRSSSSEITITYKFSHEGLNRYKKSSEFRIAFQMSDITCGGIVKNTVGTLTPPMSLSKLLPRVKCVWNLQASPGFTFLLDILFHADDGNNYYFYDEKKNETCFPDFKIREKIDDKNYLEQTFCKSGRVLELYTLNGELIYDDRSSRESRATQSVSSFSRFVISYEEAPISPSSCSQSIDTSQTISFNSTFPRAELCLLSILQLTTHGTVSIKISDFGTEKIRCEHSLITVKSNDFPTFEDKYCASSIRNRTLDFVFTNHHIGLSVFQDHRVKQNNNFTIDIDFLECGGVIDRSTNFGNISMPISQKRCRWDFEAPVGQIIKIKVISMKIRTTINCFDNALYIREGRHDEQGLLHTYCHTTDNPGHETERLRDEYRVIKSKTRCLNIEWVRNTVFDTTMNWVLEYSYIDEGNDCGFHSSALSGVITTPNYNEKDYDNNLECIWDIHVPPGYHIKLNYEFFDVETSDNCVKDALIITETSQSMELALITSYQVQPFEEVKYPRVCGHHTPKDTFASTTRRLQLNFTTDGTVTSRGFKIRWEAECGAILTKEHGTVTSPNYPEAYTIAKDSCGYIIQADAEDIVSIRFEDVDLPIAKMRNNKCYADHIQIVQIPSNKILLTICGNNDVPEEVLSFRGTIGISLNKYGNYKTPYRGFKLTYQREECGKSIHLDDENNQVYINSPAFPLAHKHSLDCQWNVTTTRDRQLGFRFERFELDERSNCESDYVLISAKYYRSKHCGGRDDVSYETTNVKSSVMNVHLVTDAENNGKGFVMSIVSLLRPEQGCGGVVIADNTWRSIQPPRDKDGKYLPNLHCIWRIKTRKSSIQLKITDIDIERGPRQGCSYDYIKVYNGYHDIGVPLTDRICGNQSLPIMINKGGTSIELVFETDSSGSGSGFNMSYIMKNETACEIGLEPEYEPKKYRFEVKTRENTTQNQHVEEQRCSVMFWHTGEQKMITFNEIDFKSCDDGFVEIQYYGASDDSTLQHIKLCNNQTFTYTTPRLVIITMTAKNFDKPHAVEFTYQKVNVCNRTINTSLYGSGRVLFNTYIDSYANLTQCTTTIRSANNHGHSKSFLLAFKYYPSDGVQLQAKNIDNNHTLQNSYYGEELNITMNSTYSANRKAYDGTYFTVAEELDDGTIIFAENKDSSGTVTNIGYPNGYPASKTQIFTIRPPYQTPCTVHLETVSMNIRSDCNGPPTDEYLTVDIQQPSGLKNFDECEFGRFSEHKVNINGNEERVWKFTFKSDNNTKNDGRGFKFTWFCDVKLKHSRRHEVWL